MIPLVLVREELREDVCRLGKCMTIIQMDVWLLQVFVKPGNADCVSPRNMPKRRGLARPRYPGRRSIVLEYIQM